jgi:hypothetical protein
MSEFGGWRWQNGYKFKLWEMGQLRARGPGSNGGVVSLVITNHTSSSWVNSGRNNGAMVTSYKRWLNSDSGGDGGGARQFL